MKIGQFQKLINFKNYLILKYILSFNFSYHIKGILFCLHYNKSINFSLQGNIVINQEVKDFNKFFIVCLDLWLIGPYALLELAGVCVPRPRVHVPEYGVFVVVPWILYLHTPRVQWCLCGGSLNNTFTYTPSTCSELLCLCSGPLNIIITYYIHYRVYVYILELLHHWDYSLNKILISYISRGASHP